MTTLPPGDDIFVCPNCKTINHPNVVICVGCGIQLNTYNEIKQRWQERQNDKKIDRLNQLQTSADLSAKKEVNQGRLIFSRQLLLLVAITAVLIVLIWCTTALLNYRRQVLIQQLNAKFQQGASCYDNQDYVCARDAFIGILKEDANYPNIKNLLISARISLAKEYLQRGQTVQALKEMEAVLALAPEEPEVLRQVFEIRTLLAEQYALSNRWQDAIDELDKALAIRPGDAAALQQMKAIYNRWYTQTIAEGDRLKAWWIRKNLKARFPD